jgi:hypothetical protein
MDQTPPLNLSSSQAERLEQIESELKKRLGRMDANIEQLREGEFIRHIIRREAQSLLEEEDMERQRRNSEREEVKIHQIKRRRRNRIAALLAGVFVLGASTYGYKRSYYPQEKFTDFIQEAARKTADEISTKISEWKDEEPPFEGQKRMWVTPEEERLILAERLQSKELERLTKELAESRLQLEGWTMEPMENPLRENALEFWRKKAEKAQDQIKAIWNGGGGRNLRAAPVEVENKSK